MLQFLPYALAAYGGYQGYRSAKDAGASGLGRLLGGAIGAYGGYNLGQAGGFAQRAGFGSTVPTFTNIPGISQIPGMSQFSNNQIPAITQNKVLPSEDIGAVSQADAIEILKKQKEKEGATSILDILKSQNDEGKMVYNPAKVSGALAATLYAAGAFDNQPTDIYSPGYNMSYLELQKQRPGYTYIDPATGQEKEYEKVYAPEEQGKSDRRFGPYSMNVQRLRTGGIAEIQKFNEGGINYLPSKVSHDENDANNYVRASGYVEDGAGVGDKDEDTMLAQLADGEFVTRADGVLGAGIIAGGNPNSMKDLREKGAKYFYEQQARYKRVFDLLKEKNGDSTKKN
jgi:hypothetical protein|tara:strand:- start:968 stop:1993 length:1026 start_codon:yes stop_codon:yes gene_type:complete